MSVVVNLPGTQQQPEHTENALAGIIAEAETCCVEEETVTAIGGLETDGREISGDGVPIAKTTTRTSPESRRWVKANLAEKRARAAREARNAKLRPAIWIGGGIVLAGSVLALMFLSPVLKVSQVDVGGVERLSSDEVLEASGITTGDHMLSINVRTVENTLELQPWIADATVDRDFPNRLRIHISEREPVAIVNGPDGSVIVDKSGFAIAYVDTTGLAVPRPAIASDATPRPGEAWADESGLALLDLIEMLPNDVLVRMTDFGRADGGFVGTLRGGTVVEFGADRDFARKAKVLAEVIDDIAANQRSVAKIVLTSPDAPAILP